MQIWLKSIDIDMRSKVRVEGLNFLWPLRWWSWFEWDISRQLSENEWWDGKLLTGRKIILEETSIHLSLPYLCCSGMFSSERSPRHEWDQLAVVRSISVKLSTLAEKKSKNKLFRLRILSAFRKISFPLRLLPGRKSKTGRWQAELLAVDCECHRGVKTVMSKLLLSPGSFGWWF